VIRTLPQQAFALRETMPQTKCRIRQGVLSCTISLQPTAVSRQYTLGLRYTIGDQPMVRVLSPQLELHPEAALLPHTFLGGQLCLNYPWEWQTDMVIAHTTLPWTCEWLYHYEIWLVTGTWTGGGHDTDVRS
jgi:hypothetical protein